MMMTADRTVMSPATLERARVLLINGSEKDDRTCRMIRLARELLNAQGIDTDVLDPVVHQSTHVYEKWLFAHAVIIIAPAGSSTIAKRFKPAIDRLASAGYPRHLADLAYGVIVHGDPAGSEDTRNSLTGWLDALGMVDSDSFAPLDRHMGYHEPSRGAEQACKGDEDYQAEVRIVARAVASAIADLRAGRLSPPERRIAGNQAA